MRKVSPLKAPGSRAESTEELTHVSLFSGIGGIDLAAEWAGFKTVAFVERDPFCQKVLAKHWPEVPIYDDVKEFRGEVIRHTIGGRCSGQSRGRTGAKFEDGHPRMEARVHLLSGGFPCQPFSVAGKRKGVSDERFLWNEMLRVIREVQPLWVLGENVRGLLSIDGGRTFGTIIHELAEVGYRVGWGVYGACHVAAPHRRERVFIVANRSRHESGRQEQRSEWERVGSKGEPITDSNANGRGLEEFCECHGRQIGRQQTPCRDNACRSCQASSDNDGQGRQNTQGSKGSAESNRRQESGANPTRQRQFVWEPEPNVGRVAHGVPNRVDRLRALGNAVVPQQVFPILSAIAEQIRGGNHG